MYRHLALAGLCLAVFFAMVGMGLAGVALPQRYLEAHGSVRTAGWLAAFFAASYMACQYPAGRLADRFGSRWVLATGFLLMGVAALVYASADTTSAIYLGRFLQGAGEAPVWACAPAYLGTLFPERRGRAMGLYNAAFHLGMVTGPLLMLLGGAVRVDRPFTAFAWLCLTGAALAAVTVRSRPSTAARSVVPVMNAELRCLWPLALAVPLYGVAYGLLVSGIPVHLASERSVLAGYLICAYMGVTVAHCVAGRLSDRLGRRAFIVAGLVAMGVALCGLPLTRGWVLMGSALALGAGMGAFAVASMALVNEQCSGGQHGRASGLYFSLWGAGYFAGPLGMNVTGLAGGVATFGCCAAVAACVVAWGLSAQIRRV